MLRYTFYANEETDDDYEELTSHLKTLGLERDPTYSIAEHNRMYDARYFVSSSLQRKLEEYDSVEHLESSGVWRVKKGSETFYVKMYLDRDLLSKVITAHRFLEEFTDFTCPLVDTGNDYTVTRDGGRCLKDVKDVDGELDRQVRSIVFRLSAIGCSTRDAHSGNFVVDDTGKVRLVDLDQLFNR